MKGKRFFKSLAALSMAAVIVFMLFGCSNEAIKSVEKRSLLTVNMLDIGKADASVVISEGHAMIIDTGERNDGEKIAKMLKKHNINKIDAIVITHFDKDHVGGAAFILNSMPVGVVYAPDYRGLNDEYEDFIQAVEASKTQLESLTNIASFNFVDASVTIEPPKSYEIINENEEYDNNFSLITTLVHGENRFVFMGDAQKERIDEWLESENAVEADFLKVPHHGIYEKALRDLLEAVKPQISVICSSQKHPAQTKTLDLLKSVSEYVLETKDGTVIVKSDMRGLEVFQNPN